MIIEDDVKLKKKVSRRRGKEYISYFTTFSIKYSEILKSFRELHNVEIITEKGNKIVLPKAVLYQYSYYINRRTGQKVPQYSITIPKIYAEELEKNGVKRLKIIVEVPG
ncbi:MAG: hypothetical protein RXR43_11685 [Sulfolobus sp.]